MRIPSNLNARQYLLEIFRRADRDGSGDLTEQEIRSAQRAGGITSEETAHLQNTFNRQATENGRANLYLEQGDCSRMILAEYEAASNTELGRYFSDQELREAAFSNREFVLRRVQADGICLMFAAEEFRRDPEIVMAAFTNCTEAREFAAPELRANRRFVLAEVRQEGYAILFADPSLLADDRFLYSCFIANIYCYDYIENPSPRTTKIYERALRDLRNTVRGWDIEFIQRFRPESGPENMHLVLEILRNRQALEAGTLSQDNRPIALMIYSQDDEVGAFENNQVEELVARGYCVVYIEVENEEEFCHAIEAVGKQKKIKLCVIAGHGRQDALQFDSRCDFFNLQFPSLLNLGDERFLARRNLSQYFAPRPTIVLESCSTGHGGEGAKNIANLVGEIFAGAHPRVFAPEEPGSVLKYVFNQDNEVVDVAYRNSDSQDVETYRAQIQVLR